MSFSDDIINRTAKRFQIPVAEARHLAEEVIDAEIARQARLYIVDVELCEEPPAKFLAVRAELRASAAPPPPAPVASKAK